MLQLHVESYHIQPANSFSQVYECLSEGGDPILGWHSQDVVLQMKYTTVEKFQNGVLVGHTNNSPGFRSSSM